MPSVLLRDRCILRVSGADARHFLHNLLTNSIEDLSSGASRYAALLTPQGKILSDLFVQCVDEDCFVIDVPFERGAILFKRLTLYRLRASVRIEDVSQTHEIVVVWGVSDAENGESVFFRMAGDFIPDPRLAALGGRWVRTREEEAPAETFLDDGVEAYHNQRIALCVPEGGIDFLYEETFPHEACLDQLQGIDFKKGCYVGQEIVSRMQHRGTARTRILRVEATHDLPATGTPLMLGAKTVGRLGSVEGGQGIALARLDRVAEGLVSGISLTANNTPLSPSLPAWARYDWPKLDKADTE